MPTYKNETNKRITHSDMGYMEWRPGEEKRLPFFVPHEKLGLTMTGEEPYVLRRNPRGNGYHEMMIEPGAPVEERRYDLPYNATVRVSVYTMQGELRMFIGDSLEPIAVNPDNNHVSNYAWDMSAYLTFEADVSSGPTPVFIKCEPYTYRGTERR